MEIKEFSELEKTLDEILTGYDVDEIASDYEEFDVIFTELCYDHNLHNELLESGISGPSDLAVYVCTIWIKF